MNHAIIEKMKQLVDGLTVDELDIIANYAAERLRNLAVKRQEQNSHSVGAEMLRRMIAASQN